MLPIEGVTLSKPAYFVFLLLTGATTNSCAPSRQGTMHEALLLQNGSNHVLISSPRPARKHMLLVGATGLSLSTDCDDLYLHAFYMAAISRICCI